MTIKYCDQCHANANILYSDGAKRCINHSREKPSVHRKPVKIRKLFKLR